ncbi:uncharacterized protein Z518_08516 [Rhinocladiella mackenziei CBS 650.93]|uniref:TauD/TfdA-like domain-containing protein n=1 Tax=Rhinocladiella mackenziei CBS 650.93 TaxID=1442369 RepID=A0A0D2J140_9EURO|nr:uncharacterized protein Z518_08516 [Rhinocladiella mackenziei CBS 650.93]KIX02575.1 hypothetical protein Z518_08516 [Rhinocladiella mackenziei CBS 650.93]
MSPAALSPEPSFRVEPFIKTKDQKFNFGATVIGLNLDEISDHDVTKLKETIWTHKVIVVKGQKHLDPKKHWELVTRFDPDAPQLHSHGNIETFNKKGGLLAKSREVYGIPGAENVRLVGKGFQGEDHYGLKNLTVKGLSNDFHADALDDEDFKKGNTRFQRWHIDAPLYDRDPAWFTTLRACKLPSGPHLTIRWDDGSGLSMKSPPGLTAFFSTSQLYEMLSPDEQRMADHSWVEYAPHPYLWIEHCKGNTTGLGLKNQGKEHTIEEIGDYDETAVKRYPFVWINPVTGEKAFQVHGICARKLFIRSSADEEPKIIDDVVEIRSILHKIQSRILRPEYICLPQIEEGDVVMWDNYGCFHSAVDYPLEMYGPRTMHQANIGASKGPVGPVPIPSIG